MAEEVSRRRFLSATGGSALIMAGSSMLTNARGETDGASGQHTTDSTMAKRTGQLGPIEYWIAEDTQDMKKNVNPNGDAALIWVKDPADPNYGQHVWGLV